MGAESFTVLAILEARDKASEIFTKIDESLGKFSDTAKEAADTAKAAGDSIDDSLLQTASGADALDVASARVAAAQARQVQATDALINAERELLEAQQAAADATGDGVAEAARLTEADRALATAQKDAAVSAKGLSDAQKTQADTATAVAAKNDVAADSTAAAGVAADSSGIKLGSMAKTAGIVALGMGIAGAVMVKAAGNFQDSTTHLVTDAGESAKNLAMVQAGILNVSTATGTSASDITNAMYHIESGGYHGASGLTMLKVAAEGAKVGNADLDTVSKTLVGTMNAYGAGASSAASYMNQLIATVSQGDMRMQDLASSLSTVAPLAAAAKIPFADIGGALATMTSQGMSARQATNDLAGTIRSLLKPSQVAGQEMRAMGLNALQVQSNLGKKGLAGTLDEMSQAVLSNTKGGQVFLGYMKEMTPTARGLAQQILSGTIGTKALRDAVYNLNPQQAKLISLFESSATSATGLKQTYAGAMSTMMGGQVGLNTALMLTGSHMKYLNTATAAVAKAAKTAAGNVDNWSTIQGTFNFKMQAAKTGVENTGIAIGSALLPAATSLLSVILKIVEPIAEWTAKHRTLTEVLFAGVAGVAATIAIVAGLRKAYNAVAGTVNTVKSAVSGLAKLFQSSAATQASAAEEGAAAEEEAAAESATAQEGAAGESAEAWTLASHRARIASEQAAAAQEEDAAETAAAEDEAAAESSASWISSAASTVAAWVAAAASGVASAATWAAGQAVKVASVVASNVAGAATTAGAWIASAASGVASAAVWVAGAIAKVAVMVAANVAGAVATAAAWVIANAVMLLGIGLLIAAVIAAVILIVKNWKKISDAAKVVFHDVLAIIDSVISWVKSHWPLLLAILTGPFGLAALFIIKHWDQIRDGAAHMISDVTGFFRSLPGRILGALGDVGHLLWSAGAKVVQGLIGGLESEIGAVEHTASSIVDTIKSFLPFSPAKRGPLSGAGDPTNSGRSIPRLIAQGMIAGKGDVTAASHLLASSAALGPGGGTSLSLTGGGLAALGGTGSAAGGATIVIDVHDNTLMTERDMDVFLRKLGPTVVRALGQAGVKVRMG